MIKFFLDSIEIILCVSPFQSYIFREIWYSYDNDLLPT